MASKMPQVFMLRDFRSALNAPAANDMGMAWIEVAFNSSGQAVIDTSEWLIANAKVYYLPMPYTTTYSHPSGTTDVWNSITIYNGQLPVCITAATEGTACDTSGSNLADVVWPVASGTTMVMIIFSLNDLK